jgi:hypothetical protein
MPVKRHHAHEQRALAALSKAGKAVMIHRRHNVKPRRRVVIPAKMPPSGWAC